MIDRRDAWYIIIGAVLMVLVSSCAGGHRQAAAPGPASPASSGMLPASVQAELSALPAPDGVDRELFVRLKQALAQALVTRQSQGDELLLANGKVVATPPRGPKNLIDDLVLDQDDGSGDLTWSYRNSGDYNQDGLVSVLDLTPLAAHFQENVEGGAAVNEVIDGNEDGVIDIKDITPLAASFGVELADYAVEGADAAEGPFAEVGSADLTSASGEGRKKLTYHLDTLDNGYYRVVPRDSGRVEGDPSNTVVVIQEEQPPIINSVSPLSGSPGDEVTFTADVIGTEPFTYAWDFGAAADPSTSADASPQVTLGDAGNYTCSLTVTNDFGENTLDFKLVITAVPHIESVAPEYAAVEEEVTFTAVVVGAKPISYQWDFGGGAVPDKPHTDEPEVTVLLQMPGNYGVSLEATNIHGSDDYGFTLHVGWPPMITGVQPDSGVSGTIVEFSATVIGSPTFSYSWDFGSGASPSTSTASNPSVLMGDIGNYDGSLTVTSKFGQDTSPFSYEVTPPPPVPNIKGVSPTGGVPHTEVTFTATVEGESPFTYGWHFGGGADPDTSDVPSPTVTLGDAGNYSAWLQVDNAHGSDMFQFKLGVSFAGVYDETEDNDNPEQANPLPAPPVTGFTGNLGRPGGYDGDYNDYFSFTGVAGHMVTATLHFDSGEADLDLKLLDTDGVTELASSTGTGDLEYVDKVLPSSGTYYLRARRSAGGCADYTLDYEIQEVQLWPTVVVAGGSLGEPLAGGSNSLAMVGGKPFIAYYVQEQDHLKYAVNSQSDGSGTWTTGNVDTSDNTGTSISLAEVEGKPAISYFYNAQEDEGVKVAVNSQPDGSGTWHLRGKVESDSGAESSIAEVNDTLAVAYCLTVGDIRFAINGQPDGSGSWTRSTVEAGEFVGVSLAVIAGKPAVSYASMDGSTVRFAVNTNADGSGTWNRYTVEQQVGAFIKSTSLAEIDGRPAIAYSGGKGNLLRFAINDSADGSGSWSTVTVGAPHFSDAVSLKVVNGLPSIAALNNLVFDLRFLQNSAADATGTWHEEPVDIGGSIGWSCSLAEVAGKPAISYGDDTNGDLKFARKP